MKRFLILLTVLYTLCFSAFSQATGNYDIIATAYVTTTISQSVVFDSTMQAGGTFTFSVLAHNGGGRAGQSDTANVKIQFYTSTGTLVSSVNSSYSANLPIPNAVCGNPCIDSAVPWSTLTTSATLSAAQASTVAYAKISMYGIDGSYWAGDYGPWYRAPTFTLNGGGNLVYNPEFGPYNGITAQGWTSSPGFGACQGAWGGSNACIVNSSGVPGTNTTGLVANANGGGPSATGGTTSGTPGGYNSTMSTTNANGAPPAPTVVSSSTTTTTSSIIVGTQQQTISTPVTVTTYSDGSTKTTSGTSTTTTVANNTFTGVHFGSSQVADAQWDVYSCTQTNTCTIYSTAPGGTYQNGSWTTIGATQYITFIPNTGADSATNPWIMILVNSDGTYTSLGVGHILVQGVDGNGYIYLFFVASDDWTGTLLSGSLGLSGQGMTFTGTAAPTPSQTNALAGGMSTTTLSAGQTGGTAVAPPAPTVVSTANSYIITTTTVGNTTTTYNQPVVVTTYSDGSTTSANNGSATVISTSATNSATITSSQQSQVTAVRQRLNAMTNLTPSSVYIQQSGSNDIYNITQIGVGNTVDGATFNTSTGQTGYQTYAQFSGGSNQVRIRQGDPGTHAGYNITDISVNGTGNYLNINQGTDANGLATGLDTGQHYQYVWVQGGNNNITTVQQSTNYQPQFGVITVNGSSNTIQETQTGSSSHQSFIGIQGSYNNIAVSQNGTTANQGNYASVTASGNYNTATVTQTGAGNNANINLINAGSPASVNLIQTGGQSYGITQTCYSSACGTITMRQGN